MHSIKNISERNKIDTQSRADAYIKRKRLVSTSDYNLKSGCTKKYSWNWKNPKNSLFWANIKKNHWAGVFFTGFFPTLREGGGGHRGRGSEDRKRFSDDARGGEEEKRPRLEASEKPQPPNSAAAAKPLHPSWVAKQQQKKSAILPFQGKKVVFNDDDWLICWFFRSLL